MSHSISRRGVLAGLAAAGAPAARAAGNGIKLSIFSKHFQWTTIEEAAATAASVGFDGVDLTVREGGHVLPARVADDLPRAVEAVRKAGLDVYMITAGIVDTSSPHAEAMLRAARGLGIRYYRWGGFRYDAKRAIPEQLAEYESRSRDLAAMNKEYGICAMYHTHSGVGQVGASIWDIWLLLNKLDNRYIGINYDVGHATVEGGLGGWVHTSRLAAPMMRGVALKDFKWGKSARGRWEPLWCAPGQGMVNFAAFFRAFKESGFNGPVQVHYEYPEMGSAHNGQTKLDIDKSQFVSILRRDLAFYRGLLRDAQL